MRTYASKTNRGQVSQEHMLAAAWQVMQGGKPLRQIAKELKICHTTLFRFIKKLKSGQNPTVGYKPKLLFTETQEKEIAKHLIQYSSILTGLTIDVARKLVYQYAVASKYPNIPSSWLKSKTTSMEWIKRFSLRHPYIQKRVLRDTDEQSKHITHKYLSVLHKLFQEHKFLPSRIYQLAELSIKPIRKYQKMGNKIRECFGQGKPVAMLLAANASGEIVPPMFVLPIADYKLKYGHSLVTGNESGNITTTEFQTYMDLFISHTKPNPSDPVLLLLDETEYHIDIDLFRKATDNSIVLLSFPLTYFGAEKMRPMRLVERQLQRGSRKVQTAWLHAHPRKPLTPKMIPMIVRKVIPSESYIKKAYRETGLWPFEPRLVAGEEFVPSVEKDDCHELKEQDAEPGPSSASYPKTLHRDPSSLESMVPKPTGSEELRQCRFCTEYTKHYINITGDKPYIVQNKTALTLNGISVALHFDNDALPKTVCKNCDRKLLDMFDFVELVKSAQDSLVHVKQEFETLVVKTEYDSPSPDDETTMNDDPIDVKDNIDTVTVSETVFVKTIHDNNKECKVNYKRKRDTATKKCKKTKVAKDIDSDVNDEPIRALNHGLIIDIKEEKVDTDDEENELSDTDDMKLSDIKISDTVDEKPSELELATSVLVSEMTDDDA